jgi:hypothetical protein
MPCSSAKAALNFNSNLKAKQLLIKDALARQRVKENVTDA